MSIIQAPAMSEVVSNTLLKVSYSLATEESSPYPLKSVGYFSFVIVQVIFACLLYYRLSILDSDDGSGSDDPERVLIILSTGG